MDTEGPRAPRRARDGARTAVASIVAGVLATGPVALLLALASFVARPAPAVRRLASVGCALGLLGTAGWAVWGLQAFSVGESAVVAAPAPVVLDLPAAAVGSPSVDALATTARAAEPEELAELAEPSGVPVLGAGSGLLGDLPTEVGGYATDGWQAEPGLEASEELVATFVRGGRSVDVRVTVHPTATDAEAAVASTVRDLLAGGAADERDAVERDDGALVRRVDTADGTRLVWSVFTSSVEVDGAAKAATAFAARFVLGADVERR